MAMDSHRAIVGCDDTRALIFDMHSGRLIRSLPPNPGPVTALYVSKMDDFLITAGQYHASASCSNLTMDMNDFSNFMLFFFLPFALPWFRILVLRIWVYGESQAETKLHFTRSVMRNHDHIRDETQKESRYDKCHHHNVH